MSFWVQGNSIGLGGMCVYRLEPKFLYFWVMVQIRNMQLFQQFLGLFPFKNSMLEKNCLSPLKIFLICSVLKNGGATCARQW